MNNEWCEVTFQFPGKTKRADRLRLLGVVPTMCGSVEDGCGDFETTGSMLVFLDREGGILEIPSHYIIRVREQFARLDHCGDKKIEMK